MKGCEMSMYRFQKMHIDVSPKHNRKTVSFSESNKSIPASIYTNGGMVSIIIGGPNGKVKLLINPKDLADVVQEAQLKQDFLITAYNSQREESEHIQEIPEGFIIQKNMMSEVYYLESFDTPDFCSPSSEAYWSM
jgi:DNA-binding protein YbaB